ncbi:MAG: M20/M25/M40 family metallo-hydrolase [Candidatus Edwardsbacteria bacterium]|nr:M20/M25/M40 family metallo-hydrolase [Candidatus Edwardsbacteria bacterium]
MKKVKSLTLFILLALFTFCGQVFAARIPFAGLELPYDPQIQALVDSVNIDSVMGYIRDQGKLNTRFVLTDSSYAAADWLMQKYSHWGYTAIKDSFWLQSVSDSGYEYNIIGRKAGVLLPQNILMLSGHRDAVNYPVSYTDPYVAAPGADDDASGVAAAMEAARIFKDKTWDKTFEFIGFGAEETGIGQGALHYARLADSLNWKIDAMIDCDMIGYEVTGGLSFQYFRDDTTGSYALSETVKKIGLKYVPALLIYSAWIWFSGIKGAPNAFAFMSYNFPSLEINECGCTINPYYHTANDTAGVLNPAFLEKSVRTMVAGMAVFNLYPSPVESLSILSLGDGERLLVSWEALPEPDVSYYKIYYGLTSGVFDSVTVYGLSDTLEGLQTESTYHITVRGFDAEGHPSWFAWDFSGTTALGVSNYEVPVVNNTNKFKLQAGFPNPANQQAKIVYHVPQNDHLYLEVCNIYGQTVKTLINGTVRTGRQEVIWLGDNNQGNAVSSGIYFCRAKFQKETVTQKIVILK